MGIHKVIEVLAQSDTSWDDAAKRAIEQAGRTVRDIKSLYVKEMMAVVENGSITKYRINAKITFEVDEDSQLQR